MNVLEEVKRIQVEQGLSNSQVAKLLGYKHRECWIRIKGGRAPASEIFEMRATKAFPELDSTLAETQQDRRGGGIKPFLDKIVLRVKKFV